VLDWSGRLRILSGPATSQANVDRFTAERVTSVAGALVANRIDRSTQEGIVINSPGLWGAAEGSALCPLR